MKAFSFTRGKSRFQIGIEFEGERYNFSRGWELYKQLKNEGKGPGLDFLQVMVEADFFSRAAFQEVFDSLREQHSLDDLRLPEPFKIEPPIGRPQKVLCIGRNYKEHAAELGNTVPDEPIFFSKSPSALLAHEGEIRIPKGVGRVDFEGELAIVVGRRAKNVSERSAMDYVAGFTILNDVTARDLQKSDIEAKKPWFRSKSFDSFCPCGPYLAPKDSVADFQNLVLQVRVNGEARQQARTSQMIFAIPELVAYLSRHCTLEPGDLIATGTPSGIGPLQQGDVVECEITSLGTLRNSVV